MAFSISPAVTIVEKDQTAFVPGVSSTTGAFCGAFAWGPIEEPLKISSEQSLYTIFGGPTDNNFQSYFTASNFLSYSSDMFVVRVDSENARNAVSLGIGALTSAEVIEAGSGFTGIPTVNLSPPAVGESAGSATATLKVVSVAVNSGGTGWQVNDTFTINIGSGSEATFRVTGADAVTGEATTVALINAGVYSTIFADSLAGVETFKMVSSGGAGLTIDVVLGLNSVLVQGGYYITPPTADANNTGGTGSVVTNVLISTEGVKIKNEDDYNESYAAGSTSTFGMFAARYAGSRGNDLRVVLFDKGSYDYLKTLVDSGDEVARLELQHFVNIFNLAGANLNYTGDDISRDPWTSSFAASKGIWHDVVHVVIYDSKVGTFSGVSDPNHRVILEKYDYLSKLKDARRYDGSNNFYKNVINNRSQYLWWLSHPATNELVSPDDVEWGTHSTDIPYNSNFKVLTAPKNMILSGGIDDFLVTDGDIINAYDFFKNSETYDVSLIPTGNVSPFVAKYVIENVAEYRKDCIAFVSPNDGGEPIVGSGPAFINKILAFRNDSSFLVNSSYGVMDSGWKYQYDRYNDTYRWIPLNGDIAGICARSDNASEPWFSPAGTARGTVKNIIKLGVNPNKSERDSLYAAGINPVTSFRGQGTLLFGDKTLLTTPSAFDRINVRRLFIVLEKAIAIYARSSLFELNDEFTRTQFRNTVDPYLRNVKSRRGLNGYLVQCDASNNPPEVVERNEFIADIYIKPARSINFITLNFIATRDSVSFEEITGG